LTIERPGGNYDKKDRILGGEAVGEKKGKKNVLAVVKSLVEIKGSLYLCIPKLIVRQCGVKKGDLAGIIAEKRSLTVFFPDSGQGNGHQ